MAYKNKEDEKKYHKEYSKRPEVIKHRREYQRKWRLKNPDKWKKYMERNPKQKGIRKERDRKKCYEVKCIIVNHYSKGKMRCECCNEKEIKFLTLDHVNNDGAKQRKKLGSSGGGVNFYRWLIKNKFPKGYQILCYNCNCAKGVYGNCPHKNIGEDNGE